MLQQPDTLGLGLDAGGSATRWALADAQGAVVARGLLPPVSGHLFNQADRARLEQVAASLRGEIGATIPRGVAAGITGLSSGTAESALAIDILAAALAVPRARIAAGNDMWIAYHAVFAPGAGHIVYAGTGSIGMHLRADNSALMVGGRGMLIDDAGSAFWIGRQALNLVLRRLDEATDQSRSRLAQSLFAAIGASDWPAIRAHVYAGGRAEIAMLARAVAAADDADASSILHEAGIELARLAQALVHQAGRLPVALIGRAASLHPAILQGFHTAAPTLDMRLEAPDAAVAAARLAARGELSAL